MVLSKGSTYIIPFQTNEILTLDTRIDLTWKDDRLAWAGVNDFEDIHQINLPASSIWYPDITLYNR